MPRHLRKISLQVLLISNELVILTRYVYRVHIYTPYIHQVSLQFAVVKTNLLYNFLSIDIFYVFKAKILVEY